MTISNFQTPQLTTARQRTVAIAQRLRQKTPAFGTVACSELGLPVAYIYEQMSFAAQSIEALDVQRLDGSDTCEVAFLFPSNTEGAMPAYILALATAMGFRVHAKLSRRCAGIRACLEDIFGNIDPVYFHEGSGQSFLTDMLDRPGVRFIQVFGDDTWIGAYQQLVQLSGKTLAFDGPGKDPFIVLAGANLEKAIQDAIQTGLFAGGAACMSPERFYVHESLYNPFVECLAHRLAPIYPMPPDSPAAQLGYMYSDKAVERLHAQVAEAVGQGAKKVLDGRIWPLDFHGRRFYGCAPIVLRDVPHTARILQEETFGPVFPVVPFRTLEEAIWLAENCAYGLTATVFGPPPHAQMAADQLRMSHALVYVNETMVDAFRAEDWGSGGYKGSGWLWETDADGKFHTRTGYRPLAEELRNIAARVQEGV